MLGKTKKQYLIIILMILLFTSFTGCVEDKWQPEFHTLYQVTVTNVIDGDTIIITLPNGTDDTLRLLGIDCPEKQAYTNKAYEYGDITDLDCLSIFGNQATIFSTILLNSTSITIEFDENAGFKDIYNRWLGYVYLLNGTDFNELLIKKGYARVYYLESFNHKQSYQHYEEQAITNQSGLWSCT